MDICRLWPPIRALPTGAGGDIRLKTIHITDALLTRLASQPADGDALSLLRVGQLSRHLQLISYITRTWQDDPQRWAPAIRLISQAQQSATDVANELLAAPCVGSWASHCVRRLRETVRSGPPLHVEASYLNAIAVVAAMRAGFDADLALYARGGMVLLPTLGAARLDIPDHAEVLATVSKGRLTLSARGISVLPPPDTSQETADWLPIRTISVGATDATTTLLLDDLDYYRDCFGKPIVPRLSAEDSARFAALTQAAWQVLAAHAPARAKELAGGLRSLVPLAGQQDGRRVSVTSVEAFGAIGLSLPKDAEQLGATLVHEFQHSKLSCLLGLLALYDTTVSGRYFAPWKAEPRPFEGLLQGAYAFLAVTDYWRCLHQAGRGSLSERHFAERRAQVDNALRTLEGERHLTPEGRIFVSHMRDTMAHLLSVPVAPEIDAAARDGLHQAFQAWQERDQDAR